MELGNTSSSSELEHLRVIIHLDLDCFYAQVESVRLGLDPSTPLCVQQWDGVIAVNYAAREYGISRHDRIEKVKEKCPDCVLVHVETVGLPDQNSSKVDTSDSDLNRKKLETKVSLDRYREASAKIFQLLSSYSDCCEKASIDEAYLDISEQVQTILHSTSDQQNNLESVFEQLNLQQEEERAYYYKTVFQPFGSQDLEFCKGLLIGCAIAAKIRHAIFSRFSYTSSAGIAENKLLAKLGSSLNKPNQQTLIAPESVPCLFENLPLKKLRSLGGKLGALIEERTDARTVKEAQSITFEGWSEIVGRENAAWIYNLVRGIDHSPVNARGISKSILAAKTFKAEYSWEGLEKWIKLLAYELCERLKKDEKVNSRGPANFVIHYSSVGCSSCSKTIPFPQGSDRVSSLFSNAMNVLRASKNFKFPCSRLSLSVSKFHEITPDGKSIVTFLKRQETHQTAELSTEYKEIPLSVKSAEKLTEQLASSCGDQPREDSVNAIPVPNEMEDYILAQRLQEEECLRFKNDQFYTDEKRRRIRRKKGQCQTLEHFFRPA